MLQSSTILMVVFALRTWAFNTTTTTGTSCSSTASAISTTHLEDHVLTELESASLSITRRVPVYNGAVFSWAGCFIADIDSQINLSIINLSMVTPAHCANACASSRYFSLTRG